MCSSGRNDIPTLVVVVVVVDESCRSALLDGGRQMDGNEEVGGNGVAIEE